LDRLSFFLSPRLDAFRQGLQELGYVEGKTSAAKQATSMIPIVMGNPGDPIQSGVRC